MWLPLLLSCSAPTPDTGSVDALAVRLRWVGGMSLQDWEAARAGLWWSLSSMGALPPPDESAITVHASTPDAVLFTLDLGAVGFPEGALDTVAEISAELQADPSVAEHGGVDVGRFLMRSLHEPWRYYALTGACAELSDWVDLRQSASVETYAVTDSLLVEGERLIEVNQPVRQIDEIGFRAAEVSGDLTGDYTVHELEVIDLMANGRQRYAVYGVDGALQPGADPAVSPAGQPGRCLWCHENRLMIGQENPTVEGYWSFADFAEAIVEQSALLVAHRATLETAVVFTDPDVHTWGELLVEEFLAPSPERVSIEWGISAGAIAGMGLEGHINEEYPSWGPVYRRAAVDGLLAEREGWRPIETLESGRELTPSGAQLVPARLQDCLSLR